MGAVKGTGKNLHIKRDHLLTVRVLTGSDCIMRIILAYNIIQLIQTSRKQEKSSKLSNTRLIKTNLFQTC